MIAAQVLPLPATPATGENHFYGEYLVNAQGEDVVAGIRTPAPVNEYSKNAQSEHFVALEKLMPAQYKELYTIKEDWKSTIKTCRILSSPLKKVNSTCCSAALVSVMALPLFAWPLKCLKKLIDAKTAIMRGSPQPAG